MCNLTDDRRKWMTRDASKLIKSLMAKLTALFRVKETTARA